MFLALTSGRYQNYFGSELGHCATPCVVLCLSAQIQNELSVVQFTSVVMSTESDPASGTEDEEQVTHVPLDVW